MPLESQVAHRNVRNTNLPYRSYSGPIETDPSFVSGSQDLMTSAIGYCQRRPGFADNMETTPTAFNNLQRLFTWNRFDGTFFEMACDINASGFAQVYKQEVGVDTSFVSIFTDTTAGVFDFFVSNNTVYFMNGNVAKKWDPLNGVSNWGIAIGSVNNITGPTIVGTGADVVSGVGVTTWTNPGNITANDGNRATMVLPIFSRSHFLQGTNLGFAIPATSTITGVKVELKNLTSDHGDLNDTYSYDVGLLSNGNLIGIARSISFTAAGSGNDITVGGTSDLWTATLTPPTINSATFGVRILADNSSSSVTWTSGIDYVQVTIYSLGGPPLVVSGSAGSMSATRGYQYVFCYGNSNSGHVSSPTPVSASTGVFGGLISTTTIAAGGSGYAANDTGTFSAGNFNGTYTVNTVTAGAVTTFTVSAAGTGYVVANNIATARGGTQPGTGTGFAINITAVTGVASVQISLTASTDPQVNQIRVFRTTDSAPPGIIAGTFFEIPTSPYTNTTANVTDNAADVALNIFSLAPIPGFNDPPTPGFQPVYFSGRCWYFLNNKVYISGLEEITNGVPEESFPSGTAGNFLNYDQPVQGLAVAGTTYNQGLMTLCGGTTYGITGTSLDTFRRFLISNRRGCRNRTCVSTLGGMVAWLDSAMQIWATDGQALQELSMDIRPDLAVLSPVGASMTFHTAGAFHWLVVAFPSKMFVYDMDLGQWMPPWTVTSSYVFSGETSAGNYNLLLSNGTKALQLSTTAHNDNGALYTSIARTNLFAVVPDFGKRFSYAAMGVYDEPTRTGYPTAVEVDTNNVGLADVALCADDDPSNTSTVYTSIATNQVGPDQAYNRGQGFNLIQNVYPVTQPSARWIGMEITSLTADDTLKIYSWILAYKSMGGR